MKNNIMKPHLLNYIKDNTNTKDLEDKVVDCIWFGPSGNFVLQFTDGTDITVDIVNNELVIEYRQWQKETTK